MHLRPENSGWSATSVLLSRVRSWRATRTPSSVLTCRAGVGHDHQKVRLGSHLSGAPIASCLLTCRLHQPCAPLLDLLGPKELLPDACNAS